MRIQRSEGDGSAEVSFFPLRDRLAAALQVMLSKTEINNEHALFVLRKNEVRGLHVTMYKAFLVRLLYCLQHLNLTKRVNNAVKTALILESYQELACYFTGKMIFERLLNTRQVRS